MGTERKTARLSARLPRAAADRMDFVIRNIDSDAINNRSAAVLAALEAWLPGQEQRLVDLGIISKKTR